jgi:hypothetical protein
MRIFISLTFLIIILVLLATPKTIRTAFPQTDIPLQNVAPESNNNTQNNTVSSNSGLEQMTIKAQLKPQNGWADYGIKKFRFSASDGSEICPSNNCEYRVQNGRFSVYGSSGYVLVGNLKVTTPKDDAKDSKFEEIGFRFILNKTGEQEALGEKILTLEGRSGYGSALSYDIPNATLLLGKNPVLTIHGERSNSIF